MAQKWGIILINSNTLSQTYKNIKYTPTLMCEDKNVPRIQSHLDKCASSYSKGMECAICAASRNRLRYVSVVHLAMEYVTARPLPIVVPEENWL
jgi:hypothetical protein